MNEKEMYALMNSNPAFHLATVEGDQPRVRGMLLFRADENGIDHLLQIFRMKNCEAVTWTMKTNFAEKKPVLLCRGEYLIP